jgi:ParB family chromosome partitioning protein
MALTKKGLGRGFDSLLPQNFDESLLLSAADKIERIAVDNLVPNQYQPRKEFADESLQELAESIKEYGILQPLIVTHHENGYMLIAGERRWRAAQRANLREVLVVVHDVSAKDAYELALIENVQREDLDAIEFAEALDRLIKEHSYTQETLAQRVGKDRSTIANALRLLRLPDAVRDKVVNGELSEGHARALLGAPDDTALATLAEKVIRGRLSVRQTEALVRTAKSKPDAAKAKKDKTASTRDLELRLGRKLGTKVEVRDKDGKGEIAIRYASWDELDKLLEVLL